MAIEDEELPESVQAEVDAIRKSEGLDSGEGERAEETEVVAAPAPEPPRGRRAQQEAERNALLKSAEDRAAKAEQLAEKTARESSERLARLEGLIEAGNQQRQQPVYVQAPPQQQAPQKDWQTEHRAAMREAQKLLAAGDIEGYHDGLERANDVKVEAALAKQRQEWEQRFPQQSQPQQQKPIWLTAVENQFSDVLSHARGADVAAAFMRMEGVNQSNFNAETMQKVFVRARKELGLGQQTPGPTEQQRQAHAGGPVNGSARTPGSNGANKQVKVPKNWRDIARRSGMSEADYLRAAKAMEP